MFPFSLFRRREKKKPRIVRRIVVGLIIGGAIGSVVGKSLMDKHEKKDDDK